MKAKAERKVEDNNKTRESILDATEQIMRDEGYAAVSSRRVAEKAGLKSQLVHYHFGTMDDLFIALFHRAEKLHFERHLQVMASSNPLRELWKLSSDRAMGLIFEFMALANHRDAVRKEIARSSMQTRSLQVATLTQALEGGGISPEACPANVLSLLMSGAALQLVAEESIGVTTAHAETRAYVERLITQAEQKKAQTRARGKRKK